MMRRTLLGAMVVAGLLGLSTGCNHCDTVQNPQPGPPIGVVFPGPGPGPLVGPGAAPMPRGGTVVPEPPPPVPMGAESKSVEVYSGPAWKQGSAPMVRLYPPEVGESSDASSKTQLRPPDVSGSDKPAPPKTERSRTSNEPPLMPVGIPHFVQVQGKVANGLRPSLDDGLEWLQANGYKTILFLHEPGTVESADRQQVEKRGLKFVQLEVSPVTLSQKVVDEFNRIVGDSAGLPLFVYDVDGSLAGGLWYLYFCQTQHAPDDAARAQARQLGLHEDGEGQHREMWQAVQKYMTEHQP